jgi:hypothetical protein
LIGFSKTRPPFALSLCDTVVVPHHEENAC